MKTGFYLHKFYGYYFYCQGLDNFIYLGCEDDSDSDESKVGFVDYNKNSLKKELNFVCNNLQTLIKEEISYFIKKSDKEITLDSYLE